MNRKIIKQILRRKVNSWINSIDDNNVRDLCYNNTIVTGGCIASMLLKEKVNDYDIYFRDSDTALAVIKYYIAKLKKNPPPSFKGDINALKLYEHKGEGKGFKIMIKSRGILSADDTEEHNILTELMPNVENVDEIISDLDLIENIDKSDSNKNEEKYRPIFLTSNAITLSDKIQLIFRFYGEPDKIHDTYDFIHCTCYYDHKTGDLVLPSSALESLLSKQLYYCGSLYPVCSIFRLRKFIKRGWHVSGGQMLKIMFQISQLDLTDIEVLEDQLIGVDTSYFSQIINIITDDKSKNSELVIDSTYIGELIDKVF